MSVFSGRPDPDFVYEVTIYEDGSVVTCTSFETLQEAEVFAEAWTDRVPGATFEVEDRSHDHSAWEAVATDAPLEFEAPTQEPNPSI